MAKISEYPSSTPAVGDKFIIARAGRNYEIDYTAFANEYVITPSVAGNNLSVALKHLDGTDPSATKPMMFRVGNTEYALIAAMSFTKLAGTNWCNLGSAELAALPHDLFLYIIGETGVGAGLSFGYSRISHATTMADFSVSPSNEKYIAGNWSTFNSSDPVRVIGRFRAQLSAAISYNWSIPTAKVINYPIFETDWLQWTPVNVGTTPSCSISAYDQREYKISRNKLEYGLDLSGTLGGSAGTDVKFTLPFDCATGSTNPVTGPILFSDGSATPGAFGGAFILDASPDQLDIRKYNLANFSNSGGGFFVGNGFYRI